MSSTGSLRSRSRESALLLACLLGCEGGGGGADGGTEGTAGSTAPTSDDDDDDADESGDDDDSDGDDDDDDADDDDDGPVECTAPEVACGSICADLDTDPSNCGLCGRTCIIPNAEAGCAAGQCTLVSCDVGYSDCDGMLATGCEAPVDCSGGPCMTSCGSTGSQQCDNSCEAICVAPVETCNAADDDCNEMCDEGPLPDCRVGVHRSNSPTVGHFYTTDLAEAMSGDFYIEAQDFFFVYTEAVGGLGPLFRCLKPNGRRFMTSSTDCEGMGPPELTVGFVSPDDSCGSTPLYRVFHAGNNHHFYTISAAERDNAVANLGYADEGVAGYVWQAL